MGDRDTLSKKKTSDLVCMGDLRVFTKDISEFPPPPGFNFMMKASPLKEKKRKEKLFLQTPTFFYRGLYSNISTIEGGNEKPHAWHIYLRRASFFSTDRLPTYHKKKRKEEKRAKSRAEHLPLLYYMDLLQAAQLLNG